MASLNKVFLAGNITRDPEIRYTSNGTAVTDLGLAINESFKNKAGEVVETTTFVDVVVWGRQAETCGEYLTKGSAALIEGRLQLDQWQTDGGEKRSRLRVRADRVQFLGGRPRRGEVGDAPEGGSGRGPGRAPPPPPSEEPPSPGPEENVDNENLPF